MSSLSNKLTDFERYLKSIDAPIVKKLNKGLEYLPTIEGIPLLHPEVEVLYKWKNGTIIKPEDNLGKLWLFNFGFYISFEEAIQVYNKCANVFYKWDEYKFPLFASGGGEYYLIECNPQIKEYGMIYYQSIGDIDIDGVISKYDSLESFVTTVHSCFIEKAYTFSSNNELDFDIDTEYIISNKINPKSDYWKLFADGLPSTKLI